MVSELARGGGFTGEKVLGPSKKFGTNLSAAPWAYELQGLPRTIEIPSQKLDDKERLF